MNVKLKSFLLGMQVLLLSACFFQASPAPAAPNASASQPLRGVASPVFGIPFAGLSVIGQGAVSNVADNVGRYNAGSINALDNPKVEQTFLLKNAGATALTIDRVQASCGCTTASLEKPGPVKLAPGEQVHVQVGVDTGEVPPGAFDKSVLVYLANSTQPAAELHITGQLAPSVTVSPTLIDFGQVPVDKPHTLEVTVKIDPRLASKGRMPMLVSSDPALQVSEEPQVTIMPKIPGGVPATGRTWVRVGNQSIEVTPKPADAMLTRAYHVTIPARTSLGPINATLSFGSSSNGMGTPTGTQAASSAQIILRSATVLVVGTVTGDVSAQPQRLAFGMVPLGQATTRQILLTETHAGVLRNARVLSASPWLSARMMSADGAINPFTAPASTSVQPTASNGYQVLQVTLSPQAPPGSLTSQVKIMLANGEQLIIPVNGFVNGG